MGDLKECVKTVKFNIFPYKLTVIVSNNIQQSWNKREGLLGEMPDRLKKAAAVEAHSENLSFIFINVNASPGVIAHEANHCIWALFDFIGAKHEEEIQSYLLYFIVEKIHKAIKKY